MAELNGLWGAVDFETSLCLIREDGSGHVGGALRVPSVASALAGSIPPLPALNRSFVFPHLAVSADVQLHNRGDLLRTLGDKAGRLETADDRDLLLAAY